ncbi:unnamed protein product [Ambrosiozyma monospora]|uniref:Unnamed protein product n=1 Tax=Ambrosiozyma monospora TaxID=43982 RepID=A0A9W6Z5J7_AMBMO|nr:unnamed protein product [Ambrosiozyma monospora]
MYSNPESKWAAFKFKDPFASDAFCVCHHPSGIVCRPNCDMGIKDTDKKNISFTDTYLEAFGQGFKPCQHCYPDKLFTADDIQKGSFVSIDLALLVDTVIHVNQQICFLPPLMTEDDEKTNALKKSIWHSENESLKRRLLGGFSGRSSSISNGGVTMPKTIEEFTLTRNEFDHLKIIDLACRHIALAALSTTQNASLLECYEPLSASKTRVVIANHAFKKKRRRGGVLGFKELASKSCLSAWHFHRVFKSVTGLTPKNYGDKCFDYIRDFERLNPSHKFDKRNSIIIDSRIANPTFGEDENSTSTTTPITAASTIGVAGIVSHTPSSSMNSIKSSVSLSSVASSGSSNTNLSLHGTIPLPSSVPPLPVSNDILVAGPTSLDAVAEAKSNNLNNVNMPNRIKKKPSFTSKRRKYKTTKLAGETFDISRLEKDALHRQSVVGTVDENNNIDWLHNDSIESSNFSVGSSPASLFSNDEQLNSSKPSLVKRESWSSGDTSEAYYKISDYTGEFNTYSSSTNPLATESAYTHVDPLSNINSIPMFQ